MSQALDLSTYLKWEKLRKVLVQRSLAQPHRYREPSLRLDISEVINVGKSTAYGFHMEENDSGSEAGQWYYVEDELIDFRIDGNAQRKPRKLSLNRYIIR